MKKRTSWTLFFFIIILAFFSINFSEPKYFNSLAEKWGLPRFWQKDFKLGLDLQGGVHLLYEADLSGVEKKDYDSSLQGLRDIIERRVNLFGVQEPVVQIQKGPNSYRLIVELAGVKDPTEAIKMIGQTPFLEFKEERTQEETQQILDKKKEVEGKNSEEIRKIKDWYLAFEDPYFKPTKLTGKYLKSADLGFDQTTGKPIILLRFNDEGAKIFEELTSRNVGKRLAIYIDNVLISAPVVQNKISGGQAQITGNFTVKEAKELARNLKAGALPVPIKLVSQQSVGPTLGADSLRKSLVAGFYGFLAIIVFLVLVYRLPGLLASFALVIYVAVILSLFKLIPVTLTLAGIGGFILSIGMAVDANILIFSRLREELKEEKPFGIALEEAFKRSWSSIRDGNITTLIVALILFWFGTSFIKGFAFTLSIGILTSMFSAIFISRTLLRVFVGTRLEKIKWLWR